MLKNHNVEGCGKKKQLNPVMVNKNCHIESNQPPKDNNTLVKTNGMKKRFSLDIKKDLQSILFLPKK